jgi:hypothetical protein
MDWLYNPTDTAKSHMFNGRIYEIPARDAIPLERDAAQHILGWLAPTGVRRIEGIIELKALLLAEEERKAAEALALTQAELPKVPESLVCPVCQKDYSEEDNGERRLKAHITAAHRDAVPA